MPGNYLSLAIISLCCLVFYIIVIDIIIRIPVFNLSAVLLGGIVLFLRNLYFCCTIFRLLVIFGVNYNLVVLVGIISFLIGRYSIPILISIGIFCPGNLPILLLGSIVLFLGDFSLLTGLVILLVIVLDADFYLALLISFFVCLYQISVGILIEVLGICLCLIVAICNGSVVLFLCNFNLDFFVILVQLSFIIVGISDHPACGIVSFCCRVLYSVGILIVIFCAGFDPVVCVSLLRELVILLFGDLLVCIIAVFFGLIVLGDYAVFAGMLLSHFLIVCRRRHSTAGRVCGCGRSSISISCRCCSCFSRGSSYGAVTIQCFICLSCGLSRCASGFRAAVVTGVGVAVAIAGIRATIVAAGITASAIVSRIGATIIAASIAAATVVPGIGAAVVIPGISRIIITAVIVGVAAVTNVFICFRRVNIHGLNSRNTADCKSGGQCSLHSLGQDA